MSDFNLIQYHVDLPAEVKTRVLKSDGEGGSVEALVISQSYFEKVESGKANKPMCADDLQAPAFIFEMDEFEESSINADETITFSARCRGWVIVPFNTPNVMVLTRFLALKIAAAIHAWDGNTREFSIMRGDIDDAEFHSVAEPGYEQFYILKIEWLRDLCVGSTADFPSCHPLDPVPVLPDTVYASQDPDIGEAHTDDYEQVHP